LQKGKCEGASRVGKACHQDSIYIVYYQNKERHETCGKHLSSYVDEMMGPYPFVIVCRV